MDKESSPFTPGSPVPVELFVGREKQIREILRYVRQTASGKQENVFLAGERGIGKSSLAAYLRHLAMRENFLAIHVFLGGVTPLEELVRRIFEQILKETNAQKKLYDRISDFFKKYVKQLDLFGISVSFNPPQEELKELVRNFPEALHNIMEKIADERKGIFIALDDINGISNTPTFADWYKSFADHIALHYTHFPVFIMSIGLPEIRDNLSKLQPSLMRVFRVAEIDKLSDEEVKTFFEKAFEKANMKVEPEAMEKIVLYSSGLPTLMHEIGDAVFWRDEDGIIDRKDALLGVLDAAERIGKKYLDPKVYRAIRSERYRSILRKLGKEKIETSFRKSEIEAKLSDEEKKVFHNFLTKMKKLGIIVSDVESGKGAYRFVNELYPVYIWMESQRAARNIS
jgi:AAA+ ATPase superfamily predicted ATPase